MSRSEHGNARDKTDPVDRARKRRIKRLTLAERERWVLPVVPITAIPLLGFDHGPVSAADLRGVMERLPPGSMTGVACIAQVPSFELDRSCGDGFATPRTLGDYHPFGARIQLYEYEYPADPAFEMYLRLRMLATFVHEVGHHVDCAARFSRHRARGDREEMLEDAAETWEAVWVEEAVLPYIEQAYPTELAAFRAWTIAHAGIEVPLELIVGRDRTILGTQFAFESLLRSVLAQGPLIEAQVDYAFYLHYSYHLELALEILDGVLARDPDHADALKWRRHILIDHGLG
ncbi:MAG: hypothetical protein QM831_12885 [Kofleriaceae bacterium]